MAAHDVERMRIQLGHREVAPLGDPCPSIGIAGCVDPGGDRERIAKILDDRGTFRDEERSMPEHRNLMAGIYHEKFPRRGLTTPRMEGVIFVLESKLGEHPMRAQLSHRSHSPEGQIIRWHLEPLDCRCGIVANCQLDWKVPRA